MNLCACPYLCAVSRVWRRRQHSKPLQCTAKTNKLVSLISSVCDSLPLPEGDSWFMNITVNPFIFGVRTWHKNDTNVHQVNGCGRWIIIGNSKHSSITINLPLQRATYVLYNISETIVNVIKCIFAIILQFPYLSTLTCLNVPANLQISNKNVQLTPI